MWATAIEYNECPATLLFYQDTTGEKQAAEQRAVSGRGIAAGAEDGKRGPAGGGRGPRFQQLPHGDQRLLRYVAGGGRAERRSSRRVAGDSKRRRAGRVGDDAVVDVQPQTTSLAAPDLPESERGGIGQAAIAADRFADPNRDAPGGKSPAGHGGPRADRSTADEPDVERARFHGRGGRDRYRDVGGDSGCGRGAAKSVGTAWRVRCALGFRYRHGDGAGTAQQDLRAVLYDQGSGTWHGAGAVHRLWNRAAGRRLVRSGERAGRGCEIPGVAAGNGNRGAGG